MPLNFASNTPEALNGLFDVLIGNKPNYTIQKHRLNRKGRASGKLVGGNLSVLYSMLGSRSYPDTNGNILFLEDLGRIPLPHRQDDDGIKKIRLAGQIGRHGDRRNDRHE